MGTPSNGPGRGRRSKVARLLEAYELDGLGAELERAWTADGEDRRSLRELSVEFNTALLERAFDDAGVQSLDGEVENVYRLLTDDSVSAADRTRVRRRLERDGVDVDDLLDDFVSYQAIRTYLRNHRGAEPSTEETDRVASADRTIQQLRSRLTAVAAERVEQLDGNGEIDVGDADVLVDVRVVCGECGRQYPVGELLERGGCDCE